MQTPISLECEVRFGAAGSTPTDPLTIVRDVTLNIEKAEADVSSRGSAWAAVRGSLKKASIDLQILADRDDAGYQALRDAFFGNEPIALYFVDDADGGEGLDADFEVMGWNRGEPLEGSPTIDVSVKPTRSTRIPSWH